MMKTSMISIVAVVVAFVGAAYFVKKFTAYYTVNSTYIPVEPFLSVYPPGTISIKPSTSTETMMSVTDLRYVGISVDLGSAIINAFPGYGGGGIIYENIDSFSKPMDIALTAPTGDAEKFRDIVQREITKAYGVTARVEDREMEALFLKAPHGDKLLPATVGRGDNLARYASATEVSYTGYSIPELASSISIWLGTPIINDTQLTGRYDLKFESDLTNRESVTTVMREQFGLELIPDRVTTRVLIIRPTFF